MQLFPSQNFTIVRQLSVAPSESGTYYVRAIVRNAQSDVVVSTLNLLVKTGYRYTGTFLLPPDPLGLGYFVSIVTSVYTDSGYTTKSEVWSDEENTYLVAELKNNRGAFGGATSDEIRRIIRSELSAIEKPESFDYSKIPKPKEYPMRWDEIMSRLGELSNELKPKAPEKINLSPITSKIDDVLSAIESKPVTEPTDLQPILDKLATLETKTEDKAEEQKTDRVQKHEDNTQKILHGISILLDGMGIVSVFKTHTKDMLPKVEQKAETLPEVDISKLM